MKKLLFLGTPDVAAMVLSHLLEQEGVDELYTVVGVVSQPPSRSSRKNGNVPSPVHALALQRGLKIYTPEKARDAEFLREIRDLAPDVCVTAAYGNVLPDEFLQIPAFGTLNIHPSSLPRWRGAAPVQRSLEAGEIETGVSVLFTVKAMDAGPIAVQKKVCVGADELAPELLSRLFLLGASLLIDILPDVFSGKLVPVEQDASFVTHAKKLEMSESLLKFELEASVLHNKVRAFSGWPGTRAVFSIGGEHVEMKIVKTRLGGDRVSPGSCVVVDGVIRIGCKDGTSLEVIEIQAPGKKAMLVRDFVNGIKGKIISIVD